MRILAAAVILLAVVGLVVGADAAVNVLAVFALAAWLWFMWRVRKLRRRRRTSIVFQKERRDPRTRARWGDED